MKVRLSEDDNAKSSVQIIKDLQRSVRTGCLADARRVAETTPLTYEDTVSGYEVGALRLYYAVKVLLVVLNDTHDFSFVTGELYDAIEALLKRSANQKEAYLRLLRARLIIEQAALKPGFMTKILKELLEMKVETMSVEALKHYAAILCFNYEAINAHYAIEMDVWQARELQKTAMQAALCAKAAGYPKLEYKVMLHCLSFQQILRPTYIDQQRTTLMSRNMKTKLTPHIMSFCALRWLKFDNNK